MLIVTALNITGKGQDKPMLAREDGTADYDVWVGINHRCLWHGKVVRHMREDGAATLLEKIAAEMRKGDDDNASR